jgi:hypothetical protein
MAAPKLDEGACVVDIHLNEAEGASSPQPAREVIGNSPLTCSEPGYRSGLGA